LLFDEVLVIFPFV